MTSGARRKAAVRTSDYSPDALRGARRKAAVWVKALIFDFDGLILDTETPEYQVWQSIYREHGYELPDDEWGKIIGGYGLSNFDAAEHLSHLSQGGLDSVSLRARHRSESHALINSQSILPGVMDYIHDAKRGANFVVAVPNPLTSTLLIEGADLKLDSLNDLSLSALLNKVK